MNIDKFFSAGEINKINPKNKIKEKCITIKQICKKVNDKLIADDFFENIKIRCLVKRVNVYKFCTFITVTDVNITTKYSPNITVIINAHIYKNDIKENDVIFIWGNIILDKNRGELKLKTSKYSFDNPQMSNFDKVKFKLHEDGIFKIPNKVIPDNIKNLAIISSENAAGLKDCINMLQNGYCCNIYFYHSLVQGKEVETGVIENIKVINTRQDIDVILIIRGGGSKTDLEWFDNYNIAVSVKKSRIPVICGIGHEIDHTILDLVSDHSCTTPTQVGHFILEKLLNRKKILEDIEVYYNNFIKQFANKMKVFNTYIVTGNNIIKTNLKHKLANVINVYNENVNEVENSIYKIDTTVQIGLEKYNSFINNLIALDNSYEKNIINVHKLNTELDKTIHKYASIKIYNKTGKKFIHTRNSFLKALKGNDQLKFKFIDGDINTYMIKKYLK